MRLQQALENKTFDADLAALYGADALETQRKRFVLLLEKFRTRYDCEAEAIVLAPGRTELGGNHTDHNGGHVLAAGVHLDLAAAVGRTDDTMVRMHSEAVPGAIELSLQDLAKRQEEEGGSTALVRGVASYLHEKGRTLGGFRAVVDSTLLMGAGLSSSAAFEVLTGRCFSLLYNNSRLTDLEIAAAAKYAENEYFGKPCGFMDQLSSATAGVLLIDFNSAEQPDVTQIKADISGAGYELVVVDTGVSHADLTDDYASIPREMHAACTTVGVERARDLTPDLLRELIAKAGLREVGARPLLRVLHFLEEDKRVLRMAAALEQGDFATYLSLVNASGDSSWMLLQNCISLAAPLEQQIPLALSVGRLVLRGQGACRIHGGGFAGTIQAYVPRELFGAYQEAMETLFGKDCVIPLRLRVHECTGLSIGCLL